MSTDERETENAPPTKIKAVGNELTKLDQVLLPGTQQHRQRLHRNYKEGDHHYFQQEFPQQDSRHLMKSIQIAPMGGISSTLQEERERKGDIVPEISDLDQEITEADPDTKEMLKLFTFGSLFNPQLIQPPGGMDFNIPHGDT
ncbi:40S ribosomal protein S17 [Camelus dromedarius]|uniref:40S ribosomal protein S17 n=1 Tax=Camelus dromedarius TaxID=9838 RepID=A0A5N4EDF0_CAMDR|nr:40S ribosomal protein S17 [Camelus dromedarius]